MNSIGFSNLLVYFLSLCYKLIKANKFNKVAGFASNIDMSLHQWKSAMASQPAGQPAKFSQIKTCTAAKSRGA